MTRRRFLAGSVAPLVAQQRQRPNIVFLLTDDQRWDTLGCNGNAFVRTPAVDRLAENGRNFTRHFVTTAICVVSRASIFTGLYGRSHRILEFANPFPEPVFARSYPALLHRAGYRNGFIGKWGIDGGKMPTWAFDYFRGFQGQGKYFPEGEGPGKPHLTDIMADQAVEFIGGSSPKQPFCLSVSFKAPHVQDEDPRQFLYAREDADTYAGVTIPPPRGAGLISALPLSVQRSEARRRWGVRFSTPQLYQESTKSYYRLINGVDRAVARIVEALEKSGAASNTVILYTGDNGMYMGDRGLAGKWYMHEESIHVPLIVCDPRQPRSARGTASTRMTLNIDLAPTVLEIAGIDVPATMQGRSIVPLVEDKDAGWRQEWFYEHHFTARGWIPRTEGIRTDRWKYTNFIDEQPPFEELYDLEHDRFEERNLANEKKHHDQLAFLRARREIWIQALARWTPETRWQDPAGRL